MSDVRDNIPMSTSIQPTQYLVPPSDIGVWSSTAEQTFSKDQSIEDRVIPSLDTLFASKPSLG